MSDERSNEKARTRDPSRTRLRGILEAFGRLDRDRIVRWARAARHALLILPAIQLVCVAREVSRPEPLRVPADVACGESGGAADETGCVRFGLPENRRRQIFGEIVRHKDYWWGIAKRSFANHTWSQHDHFAHHLSDHIRMLARRYRLNSAVIYLIYDEGVRRRWSGADGKTFEATWTPLDPRIN